MKPFEIFRTGRHTPMNGIALEFADADLSAVAASYDPDKHQAPIVVGHPKVDAPAFGWIAGVHVEGDRLVATPSEVDPAFSELVQAGRFKKVSASLYKPTSPGNPTPGSYYLRHVGFLGAQPPAVKGLKAIEFAGADEDLLTIEFSDWTLSSVAGSSSRLFRRIRDWFVAEKGVEVADALIPEWEIESLSRDGIRAEPELSRFSEPSPERKPMPTEKEAADAAELQRRIAAQDAREAEFAERQAKSRADEDEAFVISIVQAGRLPKVQEARAIALFAELDDDVISFGEGDAAVTTTPRGALRELLSGLPLPLKLGEEAKGTGDGIDFSDPVVTAGIIVTEIQAAAAKGETISSATALGRLKQRAAA